MTELAVPALPARPLCADEDPSLWFPPANGKAAKAREICGRCPAAAACLEWALDTAEPSGVWAGLFPDERKPIARQRKRLIEVGVNAQTATYLAQRTAS